MRQTRPPFRSDFWWAWVIASVVGLTLAGIVFAVFGWSPWAMVSLVTRDKVLGTAASGALIGVIAGLAQWLVLRRYLRTSSWWIGTSVAGWALVGITLWGMEMPVTTDVGFTTFISSGTVIQWVMVGSILGLSTGVMQLMILPLPGNAISPWLFLNTAAWAVALGASWPIALSSHSVLLGPLGLISGVLGGAISGAALTWLLRDSFQPEAPQADRVVSGSMPGSAQTSRFTSAERIGGMGLFAIACSLLPLLVRETTLGFLLLGSGIVFLAYSIRTRRHR